MDRIRRNERMTAMMKLLSGTPNRIFTLSSFCELFGTAKSTIRCYDVTNSEPVKSYSDTDIPVYAFDSSTQTGSFEAAPMAEEIIFVDGKLLIMSESASMKYFFGNLTGGRYCYATDVDKLI